MSTPRTTEVLVVGGGPAGSAAATVLARSGIATVLVDKARFPRDKCCGDGLTTGALRRLDELGLRRETIPSFTTVDSLAVRSPRGRVAYLPLVVEDACAAAVAPRRELDAALLALAAASGATVLEGRGLSELSMATTPDGLSSALLSDGTTIAANVVIGADGAWSKVRSQLGSTAPVGRVLDGDWHAWRAYVGGVGPFASERLWVWFDPALLPGYAWSFPLAGGRANVGICMRRTPGVDGKRLGTTWRDELAAPFLTSLLGPDARLEGPARSWPIPSGIDKAELSARGGRVLFVGDAAFAADPFTGEGIAQALETGMGAASALVRYGPRSPQRAAAVYEEEIQRSLALEHRIGRVISTVLSSPLGARGAVRLAGWNAWTRRNAGRWLYEAVPRTLPLTPSKWHRSSLVPAAPFSAGS